MIETWIRSKVGCGYVYGATGWVCSLKRRQQQAEQYPEHAETIMNVCSKWDGKECYDCAQLIRRALESVGMTGVPSGATSQWKKKSLWTESGTIDSLPSDGLVALCREADGKMQHIGWRMSDGTVIDARSSQKGVITSEVSSYKWTHWMRPNLEYKGETTMKSDVLYEAVVSTSEHSLRVREWAKTGMIVGYVPTGKTVEVLAEDKDNWWKIRYGELVGYASGNLMTRVDSVDTEAPANDTDDTAPVIGQTVLVSDDGVEITMMGNWRVMVNG